MGELTVSQARENLAELIDSTQRSGEPVVLTRHGRPVAASIRRGWAGGSANSSHTSTALSSGINSQPRRAPLR
jgi:antitoxin (DNA-binding transcriptional repressor) of toxin-antitoxin stability system